MTRVRYTLWILAACGSTLRPQLVCTLSCLHLSKLSGRLESWILCSCRARNVSTCWTLNYYSVRHKLSQVN